MALFTLASSLSTLVLARVIQGIGGAGIMSVNGALIRFIYPRAQLGRAVGNNVLVVATSSAAGPSIAAGIMALTSWPWLFAVQAPFGILALLLSLRYLPRSPLATHRFDPISALLNAIAFGLFITGLDGIGRGQSVPTILLELGVCLVVGTMSVRRQLGQRAPEPEETIMLTQKVYNGVTASFFLLVALMQGLRLLAGWPVTIGSVSIPVWVSVFGILIAGYLSYTGFRLGWRK